MVLSVDDICGNVPARVFGQLGTGGIRVHVAEVGGKGRGTRGLTAMRLTLILLARELNASRSSCFIRPLGALTPRDRYSPEYNPQNLSIVFGYVMCLDKVERDL